MRKVLLMISVVFILISCANVNDKNLEDKITETDFMPYHDFRLNVEEPSDKDKGKKVRFGAIVNRRLEDNLEDGDRRFEMYIDNYDTSLIIEVSDDMPLESNGYFIIEGTIEGVDIFVNHKKEEIKNLIVTTTNVESSTYEEALSQSIKTVEINAGKTQNDFEITIEKIEFSNIETRVFVDLKNNTKFNLDLLGFNYNIIAGEQSYSYMYSDKKHYEEPDESLAPNTSSSGTIILKPINIEDISSVILQINGPMDRSSSIFFENYIFEVNLNE